MASHQKLTSEYHHPYAALVLRGIEMSTEQPLQRTRNATKSVFKSTLLWPPVLSPGAMSMRQTEYQKLIYEKKGE